MMANLWSANSPSRFWMCESNVPAECWVNAVRAALPTLGVAGADDDVDELLRLTLGEGQFGADHWRMGVAKRLYYEIKPFMPRAVSRLLRQLQLPSASQQSLLSWPIEERFVSFTWEVLQRLLAQVQGHRALVRYLWPGNAAFALVLTHDIETADGQRYVPAVAALEESLGLRSSFNLVADRYRIDEGLVRDLRARGFEVGVHGLKHDGKLFASRQRFDERARKINSSLQSFDAVGFRAPLTHRQPEWMQVLQIEYDSSFFDTDPYEPIPGGVMTIYPFYIGRFVELPYTLPQDYTLASVLQHSTPQLWLHKVDYIARRHGMALLNTHPDYLRDARTWQIYEQFLLAMSQRGGYWPALPRDVARWWRLRSEVDTTTALSKGMIAAAEIVDNEVRILAPATTQEQNSTVTLLSNQQADATMQQMLPRATLR